MSREGRSTDPRGGGWVPALPPWLSGRLVFGVSVAVIGVLFTLDRLGTLDAGDYLRWWPLALIAIGLVKAGQPRGAPGRIFGGVLMVLGVLFLLETLRLASIDFELVFPLLLVTAGSALVWQSMTGSRRRRHRAAADAADTVSGFALLGGLTRRSVSTGFRGGELTAVLGACEIDLSQAALAEEGAVLDLFAMWGGIEIRVPREWRVVVDGVPVLGAFEDHTSQSATEAGDRTLRVRGMVVMGGVEIKN
jgi:hypothetical protein